MGQRSLGSTAIAVALGAVVLQVFVPAMFDIAISVAIGASCGYIGYRMGRSS